MNRPIRESEKKTLAKICSNVIVQGPEHEQNIKEIFVVISKACAEEFSEDNIPTLKAYLMELLEDAIEVVRQKQELKYKKYTLNRLSDEDLLKLKI